MLSSIDSALASLTRQHDPATSLDIFDAIVTPNAALFEDMLTSIRAALHTPTPTP